MTYTIKVFAYVTLFLSPLLYGQCMWTLLSTSCGSFFSRLAPFFPLKGNINARAWSVLDNNVLST